MLKAIERSSKPIQIAVRDAQSLEQCIADVKEAWLDAHPQERKRRGRPSEMERVFMIIWGAEQKRLLGKAPSQGKVFKLVNEELGDKALSEKAIRKYAKMWLLLYRKPWTEWSEADRESLAKHAPLIVKYQRLFLDTLFEYGQPKWYSNGVELVIRGPHLTILGKILKSLSHEMARFNPPKGVEGYTYPEISFLRDALRGYVTEQLVRRRPG